MATDFVKDFGNTCQPFISLNKSEIKESYRHKAEEIGSSKE